MGPGYIHCCGRFSAATPPVVEVVGTGDWTVVRNGVGDWTVTMSVELDVTERLTFVLRRGVLGTAKIVPQGDEDIAFRVVNELDDGTPTDAAIDFLVINVGDGWFTMKRWAAACNDMRLDFARLTWLGRRANRPGWVGASVLAESRRRG